MVKDIRISVTDDYERLVDFFIKYELEFSEEDEVPTDLLKCWKAEINEKLVGGCVLALRDGEYIIDGIATDISVRESGLGKRLLDTAVEEVKSRGGNALYLVARAPEFFKKQGFLSIPREEAPNFFECFTCPQYNVSCHPEVMKLSV